MKYCQIGYVLEIVFFVERQDVRDIVVFTALKETVLPDFVLNLTMAGFATVLTATNFTFFLAITVV